MSAPTPPRGPRDRNTLAAVSGSSRDRSVADEPLPAAPGDLGGPVVPILRIFDVGRAQDFYLDYLGWTLDWEHRFEEGMPLYAQISGPGGARLHLSEHHGDGTPGSAVLIEVADIEVLHRGLAAQDYPYARPGIEEQPWGRTVTVADPFGNRLTFLERPAAR